MPADARVNPVIKLKRVVLPAPLGPIIPKVSPVFHEKSISSSACNPPNFLDNPRTCNKSEEVMRSLHRLRSRQQFFPQKFHLSRRLLTQEQGERVRTQSFVQLQYLEEYLPEPIPIEEIKRVVKEAMIRIRPKSRADIGRIIGEVIKQCNNQVDGKVVAKLVQEEFVDWKEL